MKKKRILPDRACIIIEKLLTYAIINVDQTICYFPCIITHMKMDSFLPSVFLSNNLFEKGVELGVIKFFH